MKPVILIKFASRSRPAKFKAVIENIFNKISDKDNFKILVSADDNDPSMCNQDIIDFCKQYSQITLVYGVSKSKVEAINRDIEQIKDWQILCNISDDNEIMVDGFDELIREKFAENFPDLDGCVWFPDGYTGDKICTYSIIGKVYFDTVLKKEIYNNEYISVYCDNEFTEVAQRLNKIKYFDIVLCKHNHPANCGGAFDDEQYRFTESFHPYDRQVYTNRKARNFDLK